MHIDINVKFAYTQANKYAISTQHIDLAREYTKVHPDVKPGKYVLLTFSDTGSGMEDETRSRVFEPFFTTKDKGLS